MNRRTLITLGVATVLSAGLLSAAAQPTATGIPPAPTQAEPGEFLPGVARPWREVIQAAPFDGSLMSVNVKEGDHVTEGDLVAVIDNRTALAAVAAAEAAAERTGATEHARVGLALAERHLERLRSSRSQGAASEAALDEAEAARDQAKATLQSATEQALQASRNLELERVRLQMHDIRAPFSGTVVRVHKQPGSTMTTAEPILQLIAIDRLRVDLHMPVRFYNTLVTGTSYVLRATEPINGPVIAELQAVEPVIDPATRTFRCTFIIDNEDGKMPAGITVFPELAEPGLTLMVSSAAD